MSSRCLIEAVMCNATEGMWGGVDFGNSAERLAARGALLPKRRTRHIKPALTGQ